MCHEILGLKIVEEIRQHRQHECRIALKFSVSNHFTKHAEYHDIATDNTGTHEYQPQHTLDYTMQPCFRFTHKCSKYPIRLAHLSREADTRVELQDADVRGRHFVDINLLAPTLEIFYD